MSSFFGGKTKNQTSTQTQESKPWEVAIPYLKDILQQSQDAFNTAKNTGYINQSPDINSIYKDYLGSMQNSQNQLNSQMQPLINNGLNYNNQSAQGFQDLMYGKQNYTNQDIINGANSYINNDLLNSQIQAATRGDVDKFGSQAIQNRQNEYNAGGFGSSSQILADAKNNKALDDRIADVSSNMRNAAYQQGLVMSQGVLNQNLNNYLQGVSGIGNAANQNFTMAGNMPGLYTNQNSIQKQIADMNLLAEQGKIADATGQRDYMLELLGKYSSIVNPVAGMGGTSTGTTTSPQRGSSMFDKVLGAGQAAASIYQAFSDRRLKSDIKQVGNIGGHNIYTWNWNKEANKLGLKGSSKGVIAQEVMKSNPDAVTLDNSGYYKVNYSAIGVNV